MLVREVEEKLAEILAYRLFSVRGVPVPKRDSHKLTNSVLHGIRKSRNIAYARIVRQIQCLRT